MAKGEQLEVPGTPPALSTLEVDLNFAVLRTENARTELRRALAAEKAARLAWARDQASGVR